MHVDVHPAANLFPLITGEAFESLCEDIKENGQAVPVVFYGKQLLDGRNRWRACEALGIECEAAELDEEEVPDPYSWVVSQNIHRRHLVNGQRSMIAARIANLQNGEVGNGRKVGPQYCGPTSSCQQAAKLMQVSKRNVEHAKGLIRNGSAEVVRMVEANEIPLGTACKLIKAIPKKSDQAKIAREGKSRVSEVLKEQKELEAVEAPANEKPIRARKVLPECVRVFRKSETKANDLRVFIEDLDNQYRALLKEWISKTKD